MPVINIYSGKQYFIDQQMGEFKKFAASILSSGELSLDPNEISIRYMLTNPQHMIAEIECDIFAHAFKDRIDNQDQICKTIRDYLMKHIVEAKDIRVWLVLSELGHSR